MFTKSAYHLYGKPGNSGENSNGTVHPVGNFPEKSNTFRGIIFFLFLQKRPKFSVPFVWITSARKCPEKAKTLPVFCKWYSCISFLFSVPKKYQYHLTEIFHRNFRANGKRSKSTKCSTKMAKNYLIPLL